MLFGSTMGARGRFVREPDYTQAERPPETFDAFFARERDRVLGLAFALTGDRAGAEDVVQDAFLEAFRKWDQIAGYDQPGAWVRRVVANMSVSTFRRRRSELRMLTQLVRPAGSRRSRAVAVHVGVLAGGPRTAETASAGRGAVLPRGPADRRHRADACGWPRAP